MKLEDIWSEYRAGIKAFLHSRVSNPADVEDLLQDISVKVFAGLPSLEDRSKLQPWLFRTAHRTIIDFYRKNANARAIHPDDLWYSKDDPNTRQDLERCVEPFIKALPAETAKMLTAIDLEGVSQRDYAAANGLSYSTLKSRVQKGRSALREVFEGCCKMSVDSRGNISDYHSRSGVCKKC
ncbi:MAG: RNA polymerase sigma factor SigZ [Boseongicola sp.]